MIRLALVIAAIALASCSESAPASQAPDAQTSPAAPTAVPVANDFPGDDESFVDTDPTPLTRGELIGMWGLRSGCGQPTIFSEDGTLTDYTGQTGQWSLQGDSLTITKGGRTFTDEVNPLNANAFTSGPPEDGSGRTRVFAIYRRC
ncbi:hypothetical protein [Terricaulis sp.]|uniref:hypothetical protein n=1 Tax=Terricaulis sp. TaxID=2768686 RepID=UPI002AC787DC|nr:hypothetical protein [Terricaulis sp.]MDZ4693117.1 hypothetical protein [Terricaulis sp.]